MNISNKFFENHNSNITLEASLLFVQSVSYIVERSLPFWFALTLSCRDVAACHRYHDLLDRVLVRKQVKPLQIIIVDQDRPQAVPGNRRHNLILTDSFEAFRKIDVISYTANYNFNERYHILLSAAPELVASEMQNILEYCWRHQLLYCNVQIENEREEVLVYSYNPFSSPQHCRKVIPVLMNRFRENHFEPSRLFPKKLLNFNRCPLRAALWDVPPYMRLTADGQGVMRISGGIEGRLLLELADHLNFTVEVLVPPNGEQRGLFVGKEVTGALGMLSARTADLSLGAFREAANRLQVASATRNYYQSYQVMYVLETDFDFTSLEILLFPFEKKTWFLLLTVCLITIVWVRGLDILLKCWPSFVPERRKTNVYLNLLLLALGSASQSAIPDRYYIRVYWLTLVLNALILRTMYQAMLFHYIRSDLSQPWPQSGEHLVAENYTLVLNQGTYNSLLDVPFVQQLNKIIINSSVETVAPAFLHRNAALGTQRFVGASPLEFLRLYERENRGSSRFFLLPNYVMTLSFTMYLSKHSFLLDQFSDEAIWFTSLGLVEAWSSWESVKQDLDQVYSVETVFGMKDLWMIFGLGFLGLLVAQLVFVGELLTAKWRNAQPHSGEPL